MSAETLRRAASLMRERAEAATPGPWSFTDSEVVDDVWDAGLVVVDGDRTAIAALHDEWYEPEDGEPACVDDAAHIASWHPAVALAVADWLDMSAASYEHSWTGSHAFVQHALTVARAYLGDAS